jgi:hypothetical protein
MLMSEDYSAFSPSHNPLEWDACLEDLLDFAESEDNSPVSRPSNAVHMELQNNAMLPTFNLNVDRANSSVVPRRSSAQAHSPTTRREIEEMLRLRQNELSLGEVFLKSKDRSSQKLNYFVPDTSKDSSTQSISGEKPQMKAISSESKECTSKVEKFLLTSQQFYYQRLQQLPIPRISPQKDRKNDHEVMTDAVAIAAAIVQQSPSLIETPIAQEIVDQAIPAKETRTKSQIQLETSISPGKKLKVSNQNSSRNELDDSSNSNRYSRLHAIAPAPTPQIVSATMQRSQFGFGGDHSVPCVPQPPKRATSNRKKKVTESPPSSSLPPLSANSGPAYERKKQRAKDARMQLNDSIDRLSIAMSLAGTQSQQRAVSMYVNFPDTRKSMEACAATAASAKKWDRPSFVGTAADLIQCLNAQCEALTREIKQMQQQQENNENTNHKRMEDSQLEAFDEMSKKRRKLDTLEENQNEVLVFSNSKLLMIIASFADPLTLLRAQCLSKGFKACFSEETIWFQRCIQRFGISQVRNWKDKLLNEDDLHDHEDNDNDDGNMGYFLARNHSLSSCQLYRHLHEQNVSPIRCSESCMESKPSMRCSLLAITRMGHKLSAWVSLVERSNGETFRSVRQTNGQFKSLPVVELRLLVQNTGSMEPIQLHHQVMIVDASTRRRHEEWKEVVGDDRFTKRCLDLQGSPLSLDGPYLVQLRLFEAVTIVVYIHCRGCSTTSKFQQRANFTKVLVLINGTTVPLVIPFLRDKS